MNSKIVIDTEKLIRRGLIVGKISATVFSGFYLIFLVLFRNFITAAKLSAASTLAILVIVFIFSVALICYDICYKTLKKW